MKKAFRSALLIFFVFLLLFSGWQVLRTLNSYQESEDSYASLEQYVSFSTPAPAPPEADGDETADTPVQPQTTEKPTNIPPIFDKTVWPQVDFEQLAQINPDVVGWIYIEGTNISYPVVQGKDNDDYLRRMFDGGYNRSGCIFLDADCDRDFSDRHTIIYGHNMKNNSMFSGLMDYKDQRFYDAHPVALLLTPTHRYKIQFFSGYVSDDRSGAWRKQFGADGFAPWLAEISARSAFTPVSVPTEADLIVTLSTCSYEFDRAKFVLHGYITEVSEIPSK